MADVPTKIEGNLAQTYRLKKTTGIMIKFRDNPKKLVKEYGDKDFPNENARKQATEKALKELASKSQRATIDMLTAEKKKDSSITWETLYQLNQLRVNNASLDLVNRLTGVDDISMIFEDVKK